MELHGYERGFSWYPIQRVLKLNRSLMKSPPDYELLAVADRKGLPAVMLRAHALNADSFGKTLDGGACAYLTRDRLFEIDIFRLTHLRIAEGILSFYLHTPGAGAIVIGDHLQAAMIMLLDRDFIYGSGNL